MVAKPDITHITNSDVAGHGATREQARHVRFEAEAISGLIGEADTFVEFGCTDGRRLKNLKDRHPDKTFIGFDAMPLLELGQSDPRGVVFFDDWDFLASVVAAERAAGRRVCLIVSSPVQGVFTRMTERDARRFSDDAWNGGFDIVARRSTED